MTTKLMRKISIVIVMNSSRMAQVQESWFPQNLLGFGKQTAQETFLGQQVCSHPQAPKTISPVARASASIHEARTTVTEANWWVTGCPV